MSEFKNAIENKTYFSQDISFKPIESFQLKQQDLSLENIKPKEHKPIILGHYRGKSFFSFKEKHWTLNQYPVLFTGSNGAGKTEALLSLGAQYIKNNEGLIYVEAKGDTTVYSKIFAFTQNVNRLGELYCLNFMSHTQEGKQIFDNYQKTFTHSIDPINPMVGNDEYFNYFFGEDLGKLIHAVIKKLHANNKLMDIDSLESLIMFNNLLKWNKDKESIFNNMPELNEYLSLIGIDVNISNVNSVNNFNEIQERDLEKALENHAINAIKARNIIDLIKNYPDIFKTDCSVDMRDIFINAKILVILLPPLFKSTQSLALLGELMAFQIMNAEKVINSDINKRNGSDNTKSHYFQNIVLDEFVYYSQVFDKNYFADTKNNYILGAYDFNYVTQEVFDNIFEKVKTYVGMKFSSPEIHPKLRAEIVKNIADIPKKYSGFIEDSERAKGDLLDLLSMDCGKATVFCFNKEINKDKLDLNSKSKYYIQEIVCVYHTLPKPKSVWIVNHDSSKV